MFDISQGNTLFIENTSMTAKAVFIGNFKYYDKKHGYDKKTTINGNSKIRYSANIYGGTVTIDFIDYDNKETLRDFFRNNNKINLIDEYNKVYNDMNILGETLNFDEQRTTDGIFYTTSFEVEK